MKKLLPVLLIIGGLAFGGGAGVAFKTFTADPENPEETDAKPEKTAAVAKPSDSASHEFLKIPKQFVIPILEGERVKGLATVMLSLEVSPGLSDLYYAREPKIRDAFLRILFEHANFGGFDGAFTMPSKLKPLREALLEVARIELHPTDVHEVLITDIARQDAY